MLSALIYDLLALVAGIVGAIIAYYVWKFQHWQNEGLTTIPAQIPFGSAKGLVTGALSFGEQYRDFYNYFKSKGLKHGGVYMMFKPSYIPVDPEIIKQIMQKDFQHFVNHGGYIDEKLDPLSGHLFGLEDAKWKNMRVKLTPTFTSGKMKMMFQTLVDCTVGLEDIMNKTVEDKTPVDIKDILGRFTTDIIGSCAFGLECNSLKDPDVDFRKYGKAIFDFNGFQRIKAVMSFTLPRSLLQFFRFKFTRPDVEDFIMKIVKENVEYREKNNIYRKDFMHLLLQLKNRGIVTDDDKIHQDGENASPGLTMKELAAQAFVFFAAGFETSSTTMTFALYELASNPEIQDKLRKEIKTVLAKHGNELTYEGIMEMTYMDKVINETLRKYPPVPMLPRQCTKDYVVPGTNVNIKKGTDVGIAVLGLHYDPEYYPDPEKFDPERFSEENKQSRPAFTYLPFGEGPRLCIGMRFGLTQTKVGITTLLNNYRVKLNKRTQVPIQVEKQSFITTAEGGIWLDVEKFK